MLHDLDEEASDYVSYQVGEYIQTVYLPIVVILGCIGNTLSLLVMANRTNRKMSCCVYFAALAISDNIALAWGLDYHITGATMKRLSPWHCNIISYGFNWATTCSVCLIICVTADRWLAICWPLHFCRLRTPCIAHKVIVFVTVCTGLYNIPHFFTTSTLDSKVCAAVSKQTLICKIFSWVNVIFFSLAPSCLVLFMNINIIKVVKARNMAFEFCSSSATLSQETAADHNRGSTNINKDLVMSHITKRHSQCSIRDTSSPVLISVTDTLSASTASNKVATLLKSITEIHSESANSQTQICTRSQQSSIFKISSPENPSYTSCPVVDGLLVGDPERGNHIPSVTVDLTAAVLEANKETHSEKTNLSSIPVSVEYVRRHNMVESTTPFISSSQTNNISRRKQQTPSSVAISLLPSGNVNIRRPTASSLSTTSVTSHEQSSKQQQQERQLTITLTVLSFTFLILTLPNLVRYAIYSYKDYDSSAQTYAIYFLLYHLTNKLYATNNAINFYVYAITGSKFRKDLRKLMKCWNTDDVAASSVYVHNPNRVLMSRDHL